MAGSGRYDPGTSSHETTNQPRESILSHHLEGSNAIVDGGRVGATGQRRNTHGAVSGELLRNAFGYV